MIDESSCKLLNLLHCVYCSELSSSLKELGEIVCDMWSPGLILVVIPFYRFSLWTLLFFTAVWSRRPNTFRGTVMFLVYFMYPVLNTTDSLYCAMLQDAFFMLWRILVTSAPLVDGRFSRSLEKFMHYKTRYYYSLANNMQ